LFFLQLRPERPHIEQQLLSLAIQRPTIKTDVVVAVLLPKSTLPLMLTTPDPYFVPFLDGNKVLVPSRIWDDFDRYAVMLMPVVVTDNRTFCLETHTPGSCTSPVNILFSIGQFNPGCPQSTLSFAQQPIAITWQPPSLSLTSGNVRPMASTHSPGDLFPVGTTLVSYLDSQEPFQTLESRFKCSFNVRIVSMR
jgi:hypothetical protein